MQVSKWILIGIIILVALLAVFIVSPMLLKPSYENPVVPRPFKGNPEAKIIVKEYSDFQCPACLASQSAVNELQADATDIRLEYHYLPLTSIHPNAFNAAMAAECANDQNKFWEMHDLMFANQNNLGRQNLSSLAQQLGLDMTKFNACLDSGAKEAFVQQEANEGTALLGGIASTPSFFINGEKVENWAFLKNLVDQKITEAQKTQ